MKNNIKCPECDSPRIYWDLACHTWPGNTREDGTTVWMSCMGCDSAIEYSCYDCTWYWNAHLNRGNPRTAENDAKKPQWYKEPEPNKYFLTGMKEIPNIFDTPDDWE